MDIAGNSAADAADDADDVDDADCCSCKDNAGGNMVDGIFSAS